MPPESTPTLTIEITRITITICGKPRKTLPPRAPSAVDTTGEAQGEWADVVDLASRRRVA